MVSEGENDEVENPQDTGGFQTMAFDRIDPSSNRVIGEEKKEFKQFGQDAWGSVDPEDIKNKYRKKG